jgi:hypothetical protein
VGLKRPLPDRSVGDVSLQLSGVIQTGSGVIFWGIETQILVEIHLADVLDVDGMRTGKRTTARRREHDLP